VETQTTKRLVKVDKVDKVVKVVKVDKVDKDKVGRDVSAGSRRMAPPAPPAQASRPHRTVSKPDHNLAHSPIVRAPSLRRARLYCRVRLG
jgi:hypothetical protein